MRILKQTLLLIGASLIHFSVWAQEQSKKVTINGYVKDAKSGEELIGATLYANENKAYGAVSNAYGFYSLTLPEGEYTFVAQYMGYDAKIISVEITRDTVINFLLGEKRNELKEVVVSSEKKDANVSRPQMGVEKLEMKEINKLPVLFGERDVLKTIQLLPGVKSGGEGTGGLYVRGGNTDQNLILLDDAPVYNAYHLLGFFSTFNSDAIKDVTLFKGNGPAEYGGRLSSVLDVRMKEGNNQKFSGSGGIGVIATHLNFEGPIVKDKGSFIVSARRTYADVFLRASPDEQLKDSKLYFYDFNAKANYKLNENNRIFLSGYFGRDVLGFSNRFGIDWGNATGTLRWNHLYSNKLFSNTSLIYSNYNYNIEIKDDKDEFSVISKIRDFNLKHEFQYFLNNKNTMKFGVNAIHHTITPGQVEAPDNSSFNTVKLQNRYGLENAAYFSNTWKADANLTVTYGLRLSNFNLIGPGRYFTYNTDGSVKDSIIGKDGEFVKSYFNLEPRVSASYLLNEFSSIKAAYARNTQNMQIVSNSTSSTPTDVWIMSSNNVKPLISDQVSAGYYRNFNDNEYEFSTEVYYKYMQNQIDLRNGAEIRANEKLEGELLDGIGRAYGIELLLKKQKGRFHGWVGYTLSRTERKVNGINNNDWYVAKQDQTHDVSLVGIYDINKKVSLSASWIYKTGNAVTFPSGKYSVNGTTAFYYTERNGYRMPATHRLDISLTWITRKTDKFESSWNFSLYNAYGRENPYSITFEDDPNNPNRTRAVQTSLFRWIPAVTYNFKF